MGTVSGEIQPRHGYEQQVNSPHFVLVLYSKYKGRVSGSEDDHRTRLNAHIVIIQVDLVQGRVWAVGDRYQTNYKGPDANTVDAKIADLKGARPSRVDRHTLRTRRGDR